MSSLFDHNRLRRWLSRSCARGLGVSSMFCQLAFTAPSPADARPGSPDADFQVAPPRVTMDADAPSCGDFNEDGAITATDALGALNFSVGIGDCPVCICDVDSSGSTTATDALRILRGAVGLPETFDCPPDGVPLAWDGGGDGFRWGDPANWETGVVPTGCEAITIVDDGGLEVEYDTGAGDTTVHSITSDASFLQTGGELRVRNAMQFTKTVTLQAGFLIDARITADSGGAGGIFFPPSSLAHLLGATVDSDVNLTESSSRFAVERGLTFNGVATLGRSARISFAGRTANALEGEGEVVFGVDAIGFDVISDTELSIGEGIYVHGVDGFVGSDGPVVNAGTIEVDGDGEIRFRCNGGSNEGLLSASAGTMRVEGGTAGCTNNAMIAASNGGNLELAGVWTNAGDIAIADAGMLDLEGDWANTGTIDATDSTVNLGGDFAPSDVGTFLRDGGTVNLTGTLDNAEGLTLDTTTGEWVLQQGAVIEGGVVDVLAGGALVGAAGEAEFHGVTLNGPLGMLQNSRIRCFDGFTLNGVATLAPGATLRFDGGGEQVFDGGAEVLFDSTGTNPLVTAVAGTTLRIADTVVIRGQKGSVGTPGAGLINEGTIEADGTGRIDFAGLDWRNEGAIIASTGTFRWSGNGTNDGELRLGAGRVLDAVEGFTQGPLGRLVIEIDGPGSNGEINAVSDPVSLDGTLEVSLLGGYEPDLGESLRILRFATLSGDFATLEGLDIGDGKAFVATADADSYDLGVAATGP